MLLVTVTLIPGGYGTPKELGRMIIANDGKSDSASVGDYVVRLGRKGQTDNRQIYQKPQRAGEVKRHRRLAESVWRLVGKALFSVGHGDEVEEMPERVLLNAARCKLCGDVAISKHVHDFKACKCGAIAVDGGHEYLKRSGNLDVFEELSVVE